MAEQINVPIITADAVTNLGELRDAIKKAKEKLDDLDVGSLGYRAQLNELIKMQNLMRGAMNGTTASFEDLTQAAEGTTKTYNGLVNQMASMKRELRNIDVSTEQGVKDFQKLAGQIKVINQELKDMDAAKGDYQRNVGNYKSALEGMIPPLKNVNDTIGLIGKQPILGILSMLAPLIVKITDELKDNKTAMDSIKKLMESFKPIIKVLEGAIQKIAEWAADALAEVTKFVKTAIPQLKNVVSGIVGVGNSIFQFIIFPIKQSIEAFKGLGNILKDVFTGQWDKIKDDAKAAVKGINDAFTKGIDFKGNYKAGEEAAESFIDGLSSTKVKKKAAKAGKDIVDETLKKLQQQFDEDWNDILKDIDKKGQDAIDKMLAEEEKKLQIVRKHEADQLAAYDKTAAKQLKYNELLAKDEEEKAKQSYEIQQLANERKLQALAEFADAAMARGDIEKLVEYEQQMADVQVDIELATLAEKKRIRERDKQNAIETAQAAASATIDILSSIADAMESSGELSEKEEKRVKNLRIAAATISMLQGAVTAYASAQSLGVPMGPIVGAINAAAVIATGIANIAKIKATNVSRDSAPSTSTATAATVSAPALETAVPTTTVVNGARTEQALNNAARPQKVYLVESEQQAMGAHVQVVEDETSF